MLVQHCTESMNRINVCNAIINEEKRAEKIHPTWPSDMVHAVNILSEESGELCKAVNEYFYFDGELMDVEKEAYHLAAMTMRFILNLKSYRGKNKGCQYCDPVQINLEKLIEIGCKYCSECGKELNTIKTEKGGD